MNQVEYGRVFALERHDRKFTFLSICVCVCRSGATLARVSGHVETGSSREGPHWDCDPGVAIADFRNAREKGS